MGMRSCGIAVGGWVGTHGAFRVWGLGFGVRGLGFRVGTHEAAQLGGKWQLADMSLTVLYVSG